MENNTNRGTKIQNGVGIFANAVTALTGVVGLFGMIKSRKANTTAVEATATAETPTPVGSVETSVEVIAGETPVNTDTEN